MSFRETNKHIKKMAKKERLRNKYYQPAPFPVFLPPGYCGGLSSTGAWSFGPPLDWIHGPKPEPHQIQGIQFVNSGG
jgi:hypothetical protein